MAGGVNIKGRVFVGGATSAPDWDARYLRKDSGATAAQTLAGSGAITSNQGWTFTSAVSFSGGISGATSFTAANAVTATFKRTTAAGTVVAVRNLTDTADTFTVADTGGFTASAGSTINPTANAGLNIPLSGSTNGSGTTFAGTTVTLRSANGFIEISSDLNGGNYRGTFVVGAGTGPNRWMTVTYDGTNNRGVLDVQNAGNTLAILGSGLNLSIVSNTASGANTAFIFNATGGPNTNAEWQSAGTPLFRLMGPDAQIADTETAILVRRNVGGTYSLQRVTMGAVDSGGAGFKLLRVPN